MSRSKDKDINTLTVKTVPQLDLFEIFDTNQRPQNRYSNTIELYDALPKYNWAQRREYHDLEQAEIVRSCTIRNHEYKVVVKPAILKKRGKNILVYPGTREEVVEDALRKLAVSGQGQLIEDNAGVSFTLGQLRNELRMMGHTFDISEIKEAIMVCRGAVIECYGDSGETLISSNFFPMIGLTSREKYVAEKDDARCYVMFNPLVTKSIMDLTFRQYNYKLGMELPSPLARFMYKRMSHYWTQASDMKPYTPSLVSFLRQSPRGLSEDMYSNTRAMANALKVLIKHKVVSDYKEDVIKDGRKTVDVRYVIRPHEDFVKMVKAANYRANQIKEQVASSAVLREVRRISTRR